LPEGLRAAVEAIRRLKPAAPERQPQQQRGQGPRGNHRPNQHPAHRGDGARPSGGRGRGRGRSGGQRRAQG